MVGLAAIVGTAQYKPQRRFDGPPVFALDQVADLAGLAMADAGLAPQQIDGLAIISVFNEARMFVPAMVGEYLGLKLNFGEIVDLGGATAVAMAWRAAAAVELGLCQAVLCVIQARPGPPDPFASPAMALAAGSAPPAALTARPKPSSTCPTAMSRRARPPCCGTRRSGRAEPG